MSSQFNTSTHQRSGLWMGLGFGLLMLVASGTALAMSYSITDLGTLGGVESQAEAVNENGQVVGSSLVTSSGGGGEHAFIWTSGIIEDLGTLGGANSSANDINDNGQVVGYSNTVSGPDHVMFWTRAGGMEDLGTLGAAEDFTEATAINNNGWVVGWYGNRNTRYPAFLWTRGGGMEDLGTLGGAGSIALDANNSGQVVGVSVTAEPGFVMHAFLWSRAGGMQDIGTLGDKSAGFAESINDSGEVVGTSYTPGDVARAFLWTRNIGMQALGTLGGIESEAFDINNSGVAVGRSQTQSGTWHAFLWTRDRGMEDLNADNGVRDSGWVLLDASKINNAGQIVGKGRNPSGQIRAFLLTPTDPVPNVKANKSDGPITVAPTATLSLTVQLTAGNQANADWWLVAETPSGDWYYYVYPNQWVLAGLSLTNVSFAYQGPLFTLNPFQILSATGLAPGTYHVYFGVDLNMNGLLDMDKVAYSDVIRPLIPIAFGHRFRWDSATNSEAIRPPP